MYSGLYSFTLYPNSEFDFDLLDRGSREHGVQSFVYFDEGYLVDFSSDSLDSLEEGRDQLSFLPMTEMECV